MHREGCVFEADLPVGYTYYIKETAPAPGFSMTGERKEFTFDPESSEEACVSYELLLRMYRQW